MFLFVDPNSQASSMTGLVHTGILTNQMNNSVNLMAPTSSLEKHDITDPTQISINMDAPTTAIPMTGQAFQELLQQHQTNFNNNNMNILKNNIENSMNKDGIAKINQLDGLSDDTLQMHAAENNEEKHQHEKAEPINQKLMMELINYKKHHQGEFNGWFDVTITKSLKHLVTDYIVKTTTPEVFKQKRRR